MNKKKVVIKIIIADLIIILVGIYFALDGQYLGKSLQGHIAGIAFFLSLIDGLILLSEWYNSKANR